MSSTGCTACKCNAHGSSILQCNEAGSCPCLPNAEGLKCDVCKAGFFGLPATKCEGIYLFIFIRTSKLVEANVLNFVLLKLKVAVIFYSIY